MDCDENIGWLYNKSYFETISGKNDEGELLFKSNERLTQMKVCGLKTKYLTEFLDKQSTPISHLVLRTCYPGLITGIGMNHETTKERVRLVYDERHPDKKPKRETVPEFKLGVALDYTTGLPTIPGSSIKGVLRDSFPVKNSSGFCVDYNEKAEYIASILQLYDEIMKDKPDSESFVSCDKLNELLEDRVKNIDSEKENISIRLAEEMFDGVEMKDGKKKRIPMYRRDVFFDAFPKACDAKNSYLIFDTDYITPHVSPKKDPNPIHFLKIRSDVPIEFSFRLHDGVEGSVSKEQKLFLIFFLLCVRGIGAKTNVGYGQLRNLTSSERIH